MFFALLSSMTSKSNVPAQPAAEHRRPVRKHALLFTLAGPQQGQLFPVHGTTIWVGRSPQMSVCLDDEAVSAEHAHVTRRSDGYHVVDHSSRNGTYVNDDRVTGSRLLIDGDHIQFGNTIVKFSMVDELEERALSNLFDLTVRDPLTRAFNRRYLNAHLRSELAYAMRRHTSLAVLLIDIDHFKRVNDTYGHGVGDVVLQLVANGIQRLLRPYDVLCRYGGEEFVVVARDMSARNAEILAQRIRRQIEGMRFEAGTIATTVTVSVGATSLQPHGGGDDIEALLRTVDTALYDAKQAGRNQVRLSQLPPRTAISPGPARANTAPPPPAEPQATLKAGNSNERPARLPRFD